MKALLLIMVLAGVLLLGGDAYGDVYALVMEDGTVDHWKSLFEKDNSYCRPLIGGKVCVSKKDVLAIYKAETLDKLPPKKLVDPAGLEAIRRAKESRQEIDAIIFAKEAEAKGKASSKIELKLVDPKKAKVTRPRNTSPTINRRSSPRRY
ncbi:hypothetical protein LCGC14_2335030 [marine sediment metagenome]|uniref:Uncharacterized protein n=1 Tax=marine sediment metagenome TaxID=412755 RepID=A0A0F9CDN5_9ZZZZ